MTRIAEDRDDGVARAELPRDFDGTHAVHRRGGSHKQPVVVQQVLRLQHRIRSSH